MKEFLWRLKCCWIVLFTGHVLGRNYKIFYWLSGSKEYLEDVGI